MKLSLIATDILAAVERLNETNTYPCKRDVTSPYPWRPWQALPSRTRAYRYIIIDKLIGAGLIDNRSSNASRAELHITDKGREALTEIGR